MKREITFFTFAVFLIGITACSPSGIAATEISTASAMPSPTPWPDPVALKMDAEGNLLDAAEFIDDQNGYILARVVGYDIGATMHTEDGGKTWTYQEIILPQCRQFCNPEALDVVDENLLWMGTDTGSVYVSTDGAKTWSLAGNPGSDLSLPYMSFIDAQNGWAANQFNIFSTDDGGETWITVTLPPGVEKIAAVDRPTAADGYVLDNLGRLHKTADGGKTWTTLDLALGKEVLVTYGVPNAAIRFPDPQHGVIVLGLVDDGGRVWALRTADGGAHWEKTELPVALGAFHFSNDGLTLSRVQSVDITVVKWADR
jgi:photosystem II stability/assembly factor-like uncharacterized protein